VKIVKVILVGHKTALTFIGPHSSATVFTLHYIT